MWALGAVWPLPGAAQLPSCPPSLQYADLLDVLDVLSPSGPIRSQFPLTFEAIKQVRGWVRWGASRETLWWGKGAHGSPLPLSVLPCRPTASCCTTRSCPMTSRPQPH